MADCVVKKSSGLSNYFGPVRRYWYAVCPHCNKKIMPGVGYGTRHNTRKTVKDKLHLHLRRDHAGPRLG